MHWISIVIPAILGVHGIGHILGWGPALGISWNSPALNLTSWLFDGITARILAGVLFGAATLGFLASAVAMHAGLPWLRIGAVTSAVISIAATILFPHALPTSSLIGCTTVNIAVIVALGLLNQPQTQ